MKLYDFHLSGNCYKIRLLLAQLGRSYELVPVDLMNRENRRPEFLEKAPLGRVPVLEVEPGRYLSESLAILFHLSEGTEFQPEDSWERARMLQWLAFEQYEIEPSIAKRRAWLVIFKNIEGRENQMVELEKIGYRALTVMEGELHDHEWFSGRRYGIADIALYGYTHCASEGGFDLGGFPKVRNWLERVQKQKGFIPL